MPPFAFDALTPDAFQVFSLLDHCAKMSKPLVVIAEDVESEALAGFIVNKLRGGLKVCRVLHLSARALTPLISLLEHRLDQCRQAL